MFSFEIKDAIDIFLVAIMLYYTYRFMRESRSINVFIGILVFILIWLLVSRVVEMRLLGAILDKLVGVGSLAILILFQDEIRKFLNNLGGHNRIRTLLKFFSSNDQKKEEVDREKVMAIVMACQSMARGKVGALIVIERHSSLNEIVETGDTIDANINQRLIENIFFKKTTSNLKKSRYTVHIEEDNIITDVPFEILKKLQNEGLCSLSASEREWLEKYRKL